MRTIPVWLSLFHGQQTVLVPCDSVFLSATMHEGSMAKLHYLTGEPDKGGKPLYESRRFCVCSDDVNLPHTGSGLTFVASLVLSYNPHSPEVMHIFEEQYDLGR